MQSRVAFSGSAVLLLSLVVAGFGCGDDDSTPADDGGGDVNDGHDVSETGDESGGDADADDGGPSGTLSVVVRTGTWASADDQTPAEGAAVALDMPGGARVEDVTGADGRITFEGIDWSLGTASVTAYVEGYAAGSWVGVEEQTEDLVVVLIPLAPPSDFVAVSGTATNVPTASVDLLVTATVPNVLWEDAPPDWSLSVQPDVPFTMLAAARHWPTTTGTRERAWPVDAWLIQDQAAVTGATTVDLDFATPAVPVTVSGALPLPTATDSRLRRQAIGWATVGTMSGMAINGLVVHSILSADGNSIDYDVEYLDVPGLDDLVTRYFLIITNDVLSQVAVRGLPTAGPQDVEFFELPQIVSPPSSSTVHPLHDPIVFTSASTGFSTSLWISRDTTSLWWVSDRSGATTFTVPELPSTVDQAAFLGTGLVEGSLTTGQNFADSVYFERFATVGPITLQP